MKYYVSMAVDGRIDLKVEADSFEKAKEKAETAFMFADLSQIEIVGSNVVNAYCEETEEEMDYDY